MNTKKRILIFEDEASIADALIYALETEGFEPTRVATAANGLKAFGSQAFDLLVLDVGLPDLSGFEVCKQIRKQSQVPILFLTARSDEIDRVVGFEIGADDYVVKPFSPREVTARIKAVLRRVQPAEDAKPSGARGFAVDEQRRAIRFEGVPLELSRYEYGLLKTLIEAPGRVFSRTQLMERVWEEPDMSLERTVDAHIKSIRSKLRSVAPDRELIDTHRGVGYSLSEDI